MKFVIGQGGGVGICVNLGPLRSRCQGIILGDFVRGTMHVTVNGEEPGEAGRAIRPPGQSDPE